MNQINENTKPLPKSKRLIIVSEIFEKQILEIPDEQQSNNIQSMKTRQKNPIIVHFQQQPKLPPKKIHPKKHTVKKVPAFQPKLKRQDMEVIMIDQEGQYEPAQKRSTHLRQNGKKIIVGDKKDASKLPLRFHLINKVEERIKQSGPIQKIGQLLLDQITIVQIPNGVREILEQCKRLRYLSLQQCKIQSLENFPNLPKLQILQLSSNSITDLDIHYLENLKQLKQLKLRHNQITSLSILDTLSKLSELSALILIDNPICEIQNYRQKVFSTLKNLEYLDNRDRDQNELQDSSDNFQDDQDESSIQSDNYSEEQNISHEDVQDIVRKKSKI